MPAAWRTYSRGSSRGMEHEHVGRSPGRSAIAGLPCGRVRNLRETNPRDHAGTPLRSVLWPLFHPYRFRVGLLAGGAFVGGIAEVLILAMIARSAFAIASDEQEVDLVLGPLGELSVSVPTLLGAAALLTIVRVALQMFTAWEVSRFTSAALAAIRVKTTSLFLQASWPVQSQDRLGHLQEVTTTQAIQVAHLLQAGMNVVITALSLLALLGGALTASPVATFAAISGVGILSILLRPLRTATRRRSRETAALNADFSAAVSRLADVAQPVRTFGVEDEVTRNTTRVIETHAEQLARTQFLAGLLPRTYQGLALLMVVVALSIVYSINYSNLASMGTVVLIMLRAFSYGQGMQTAYQTLLVGAPYLERLELEQERYARAAVDRSGTPIDEISNLAFEHVSFSYDVDTDRPVLRDVSFEMHRGQVLGIIGPSGAGKSTLVQLVLRLYPPTSGCLTADRRDARQISLDSWYKRVAYVSQDSRLIPGTVAENIRFFRSHASDEQVVYAAQLAHIHDDIMTWAEGYETPVGERGVRLSGGQRQRICIARALVDAPDVLVLDEPTSALDSRSEHLLRDTIA